MDRIEAVARGAFHSCPARWPRLSACRCAPVPPAGTSKSRRDTGAISCRPRAVTAPRIISRSIRADAGGGRVAPHLRLRGCLRRVHTRLPTSAPDRLREHEARLRASTVRCGQQEQRLRQQQKTTQPPDISRVLAWKSAIVRPSDAASGRRAVAAGRLRGRGRACRQLFRGRHRIRPPAG